VFSKFQKMETVEGSYLPALLLLLPRKLLLWQVTYTWWGTWCQSYKGI